MLATAEDIHRLAESAASAIVETAGDILG